MAAIDTASGPRSRPTADAPAQSAQPSQARERTRRVLTVSAFTCWVLLIAGGTATGFAGGGVAAAALLVVGVVSFIVWLASIRSVHEKWATGLQALAGVAAALAFSFAVVELADAARAQERTEEARKASLELQEKLLAEQRELVVAQRQTALLNAYGVEAEILRAQITPDTPAGQRQHLQRLVQHLLDRVHQMEVEMGVAEPGQPAPQLLPPLSLYARHVLLAATNPKAEPWRGHLATVGDQLSIAGHTVLPGRSGEVDAALEQLVQRNLIRATLDDRYEVTPTGFALARDLPLPEAYFFDSFLPDNADWFKRAE